MPLCVSCLFLRKIIVSHSPLRKETDCLNCGATVQGRYCHVCGQENTEPKETFWHMFTHFFYDITHFDGSFFTTVKDLLFKPGFLSREYMIGRRKKYLHPVRMYVFTSAVFFLIFFSMFHVSDKDVGNRANNAKVEEGIKEIKKEAFKDAKTAEDSARILQGIELLGLNEKKAEHKTDTLLPKPARKGGINVSFDRDIEDFSSVKEYDSVQATLPATKRDNGLTKIATRKWIELEAKYEGDEGKIFAELMNTFLHSFPYLLFVSLPLFAFYLRLLHWRRRREYYFANHGVFLVHLYIFTFLFFLLYFAVDKIQDKTSWHWMWIIEGILVMAGVVYTLIAWKNFYRQAWGKTIFKFILFNILCTVSIMLLFAVFFGFSFYKI